MPQTDVETVISKTEKGKQMNTDFIIHEPSAVYHEQSRTGKYLSSQRLGDFRKSPKLYYKKEQGLIKESETSALFIGRAAHCLILEGRASFEEQYVVSDGPINLEKHS